MSKQKIRVQRKTFATYYGQKLVTAVVKNLLPVQGAEETRASSAGQEGPLEKNMAAHSSVLTWRLLWTEERGRLWSIGLQRV